MGDVAQLRHRLARRCPLATEILGDFSRPAASVPGNLRRTPFTAAISPILQTITLDKLTVVC